MANVRANCLLQTPVCRSKPGHPRWTGRWFDITVGLQNNLNRWYDPKIGQWLSEDPKGFLANDPNLRRSVLNTPVLLTDPSGLEPPPKVITIPIYQPPPPDANAPLEIPIIIKIDRPMPPDFYKDPNFRITFGKYSELLSFFKIWLRIESINKEKDQIARGCVGLAMFRLGYRKIYMTDNLGKPIPKPGGREFLFPLFPHRADPSESKIFEDIDSAKEYQRVMEADTGKKFVIQALQVDPQVNGGIGIKPGIDRNIGRWKGEIFFEELTGTKNPDGSPTQAFNFSTLLIHPEFNVPVWEYMSREFPCPRGYDNDVDYSNASPQIEFVLSVKLPESYGRAVYIVSPDYPE